jgi:hypothetical protein
MMNGEEYKLRRCCDEEIMKDLRKMKIPATERCRNRQLRLTYLLVLFVPTGT